MELAQGSVAAPPPAVDEDARTAPPATVARTRPGWRPSGFHIGAIAVAMTVWAAGVSTADLARLGGLGLLTAMPWWSFAALALLVGGFAIAASGAARAWVLGAYTCAVTVIVHGTAGLLTDEPRLAWTYKIIGVIRFVQERGTVDRTVDIYNNWPGLFAAAAWLDEATGMDPLRYANWVTPLGELAVVAGLAFTLKAVSAGPAVRWSAIMVFVLGDWVGQMYLAPQSLALVLAVPLLGLVLRCAPPAPAPHTRLGHAHLRFRRRLRRWGRLGRGVSADAVADLRRAQADVPMRPALALAVGAVVYLAVTVTHQLTPVVVIAWLAAFALVTGRLRWWIVAGAVAIEVVWVILAYPIIRNIPLLSFGGSGGRPSGYVLPEVSADLITVWIATLAAGLVVVVLAGLGLLHGIRTGRTPLGLVVTVILAPCVVVAAQSYGGEGPMRAYLFALPWMGVLIAGMLLPRTTPAGSRRVARGALLAGALVLVAAPSLVANWGPEQVRRFSPDEIAAMTWYETNAPAESVIVPFGGNAPLDMTARYYLTGNTPEEGPLTDRARVLAFRAGGGAAEMDRYLRTLPGDAPTYVWFGPADTAYAESYGMVDDAEVAALQRSMEASPDFELAFHQGGAWVFRWTP